MNPYTKLARQSIEYFLKHGSVMNSPLNTPKSLTSFKAGVFVSLHNKIDGELRGCIGTFSPYRKNIAEEIIYNAVAAATEDPRFPPVTPDELSNLEISVDVLSPPKNVTQTNVLDTKKHGMIVSSTNGRRGLLLPDIDGIDTVEEQERICRLKAGIEPDEKVTYHSFTVTRHKE